MNKKIGRYVIEREIGSGNTSTVFLGRDGNETVALKALHRHLTGDPIIRERFRREAGISRTLRHPGIIEVYDLITHDGQDVAVMEYCEGKSLADRKIGDPDEWIRIAREIAGALSFAHSRGIIHRDIKPRNILFGSVRETMHREPVKVGDFGSAHVQNLIGITTSTMFIGTPQYVPPESLTGVAADPRWDLYSLGAVLYQMTTGIPHTGSTMAALFRQGTPPQPPQSLNPAVPRWFGNLILGLLGPIGARPRSASALLGLLESERSPEPAETKECLFCGAGNPEDSPICLSCGKREIEIIPFFGPDAETIVLKSLPEHVDSMDHFLKVIRAVAGKPDLKLNIITEDARLYSRSERKQAVKLPARLIENLSPVTVDELIPVLEGSGTAKIKLSRYPAAKAARKIKTPALIAPKPMKPGSHDGMEFLRNKISESPVKTAGAETAGKESPPDGDYGLSPRPGNRPSAGKEQRSGTQELYSPCLLAAYRLIRESGDRSLAEELGKVADSVKRLLDRLSRLEAGLSSVSLGEIYGDMQRLRTKMDAAGDLETTDTLAKLLEEKRHTYELYQEQERHHSELSGKMLDVLHRLEELVRTANEPDSAARLKAEIGEIMRELS